MPKKICVEAVEMLYLYIDGELPAERQTVIALHLADCPPCYEAFDFEVELRTVISRKCRERAPDYLYQRVVESLRRLENTPPGEQPG
jgi:mycothiol system anti-sigma-R factor